MCLLRLYTKSFTIDGGHHGNIGIDWHSHSDYALRREAKPKLRLHLLHRLHDELFARVLEYNWSEGSVLCDLWFLFIVSASKIIVFASFLSVHMDGDVGCTREGGLEGLVCFIFGEDAFEGFSGIGDGVLGGEGDGGVDDSGIAAVQFAGNDGFVFVQYLLELNFVEGGVDVSHERGEVVLVICEGSQDDVPLADAISLERAKHAVSHLSRSEGDRSFAVLKTNLFS